MPIQNQRHLANTIVLERPPHDANRVTVTNKNLISTELLATPASVNYQINLASIQSLGNDQASNQQQRKQKRTHKQITNGKVATSFSQAINTTDSNRYQFLQSPSATTVSRQEPILGSNNELQQQTFIDPQNHRLFNSMPASCYNSMITTTVDQQKVLYCTIVHRFN